MDARPPLVITQQYSSATFVSLRLNCRKVKFGAPFHKVIIQFYFILVTWLSAEGVQFKNARTNMCISPKDNINSYYYQNTFYCSN